MRNRLYPIFFGVLLAVVCSTLLKTLDAALVGRIERNRTYDRKQNVVLVLVGPEEFSKMKREQIEKLYKEQVEVVPPARDDSSPIDYYRYVDPSTHKTLAYVFPLEGMGLWDKVKGLMAVETDLDTIRGVSFYDQVETPGLGGRISDPTWASQFRGKKLCDPSGQVAIAIAKAGTADKANPNAIDGITAATLTCQAVNRLMSASIARFLEKVKKEDHGNG